MHTALGLVKFLNLHGVHYKAAVEGTKGNKSDDAIVTFNRDLYVRICDYPVEEGGLHYILNRASYDEDDNLVNDELGRFDSRFELLKKLLVELA